MILSSGNYERTLIFPAPLVSYGCEIRGSDSASVPFVTLDSPQGDEADLIVVDVANTDHAGFAGEPGRQWGLEA